MLRCCLRGGLQTPSPLPKAQQSTRYESPAIVSSLHDPPPLERDTHEAAEPQQMVTQESLFDAAEAGDLATVRRYVAAGLDVNVVDDEDGYTALLLAAECGQGHVVECFLASGAAFVDARDSFGRTALYAAAVASHTHCVQLLLSAGADANLCDDDGRSPLWAACALRNVEVAKLLVDARVLLDASDHSGKSPLQHAIDAGHADVIDFLKSNGANDQRKGRLSLR
mmetsp:Transcript_16715/g.54425  ORF Transcript_16715/g.54425 Transcript_16715/m.54425 type:complete len:225 (+) Transcript_16715:64-738(+)